MKRLLSALALLLGLTVAGIAFAAPHVGTYLCPGCYGFRLVAPHLYADDAASADQVQAARTALAEADRMVRDFYPDRTADPVWLLCLSPTCADRFGDGPLAMTYANLFVFVGPEGARPTILAHEMAHAELHDRIGLYRFLTGAVPAWFDEGLAVLISGDDRYMTFANGALLGCDGTVDPPSSSRDFRHLAASDPRAIYTASACRVTDWMAAHGGVEAVLDLGDALRSGGSSVFR